MPLSKAEQYELLIQEILWSHVRDYQGGPERIALRQRITGASGQSHEIDLSFELEVAGVRVLFLIECKCYAGPVGVDELAEFAYKLRDIGAHKGILVTTSSFAEGAIKIAKRERIALVIALSEVGRWVPVMGMNPGPRRSTWHKKYLPLEEAESGHPQIVFIHPFWQEPDPCHSAFVAAEAFFNSDDDRNIE